MKRIVINVIIVSLLVIIGSACGRRGKPVPPMMDNLEELERGEM